MSVNNKGVSHQAIAVLEYIPCANAEKISEPVHIPGTLPAGDPSVTPIYVGTGNLIRVRSTNSGSVYITFGPSTAMPAAMSTSSPGLELYGAGVFLLSATDEFMSSSATLARIEIILG